MALPSHLRLELVTPDRAIAHETVDEVNLPAINGEIGVLPGHAPLLAGLAAGLMWYRRGAEKHFLAVGRGVAEVLADRVIVLARVAERADEIDINRADAARKRAEALLAKVGPEVDVERARLALAKALVRLQVATRARTRG